MKNSGTKRNKTPKSRTLYILGFIVMVLGLLSSIWFNFLVGIGLFFGGIILYMIGLTSRNNWNM
ncbi:MAG: hypothetical protein ACOC6U_01270 [Thermoplasmatota archaeon]